MAKGDDLLNILISISEMVNVVAKNLYRSFGFEEHFVEYVEEGDETVALLRME